MADIYDRSRAMAIRMLAPRSKGGRGLELRLAKFEQGEYDPATGGSPTIERRFDGSGMRQDYDVRVIDGSLIQQGDVEIIMSPVQLGGQDMPAPRNGDRIEFDGEAFKVVTAKAWNYAGLDIGFVAQARR